jgi:hypothetical protein
VVAVIEKSPTAYDQLPHDPIACDPSKSAPAYIDAGALILRTVRTETAP